MINDISLQVIGLDGLASAWRERGLPFKITVGKVETVLGEFGKAWSRPLRFSMARVRPHFDVLS